ncbi:pilus assembly protein [Sandarakinorhabdus sp.]|uniref:TadE/TadG family type IV pilus assembly protein n=1 Tax=Sandarakinorhabdus sp. TaxID=1916663 RepID=UPI00286E3297|nr:pilus assembly protein [Sandarakinorhabdus sp.]
MIRRLFRDRRGAAAAEFSLVLPVFLLLTFSFIGVGQLFWANAGINHAVGEGARVATLFPRRTNAQITTVILANTFGMKAADITGPTYVTGTTNSQDWVEITVSYNPRYFLFFKSVTPVTLRETRRAYRPA